MTRVRGCHTFDCSCRRVERKAEEEMIAGNSNVPTASNLMNCGKERLRLRVGNSTPDFKVLLINFSMKAYFLMMLSISLPVDKMHSLKNCTCQNNLTRRSPSEWSQWESYCPIIICPVPRGPQKRYIFFMDVQCKWQLNLKAGEMCLCVIFVRKQNKANLWRKLSFSSPPPQLLLSF